MPRYKHILALDPSGNFDEGKGTTGWVLMNYKEKLIASGAIAAKNFKSAEDYWTEHINLIIKNAEKYKEGLVVVVEDYVLYRDKATSQTNSRMETCRLLGLIQWICAQNNIALVFQLATTVKHRWSNDLLCRERIFYEDRDGLHHTDTGFKMTLAHTQDAFRHAIHFCCCCNEKKAPAARKEKRKGYFDNYSGGHHDTFRSNYQSRQRKTQIDSGSNRNPESNRTRTRVWRA